MLVIWQMELLMDNIKTSPNVKRYLDLLEKYKKDNNSSYIEELDELWFSFYDYEIKQVEEILVKEMENK